MEGKMELLIEAIKHELEVQGITYGNICRRDIDGRKAIEIFKSEKTSIQELDIALASLDVINSYFDTLTQYKEISIIYYFKD